MRNSFGLSINSNSNKFKPTNLSPSCKNCLPESPSSPKTKRKSAARKSKELSTASPKNYKKISKINPSPSKKS